MSSNRDRNWDGVVEGRTTDPGEAVAASLTDADRFARAAGLAPGVRRHLMVVVEEIVGNIVTHGAPPQGSAIAWRFEAGDGPLRLAFSDEGAHFDPRGAVAPLGDDEAAIAAAALDREGGLGWRLVLAWCDVVACERAGGTNRLELAMR